MYYVVYGILWLVSLLPLPVLYLFSDLFYALAYHVFKYRREIVFNNLAHAFPEKSESERKQIARQFYKNFTDSLIESIKLISSGKKFIAARSKGEFETLNNLSDKGYSINAMAGHQFNWEFANLLYSQHLKATFVGIYMPITNKALDKLFYNLAGGYESWKKSGEPIDLIIDVEPDELMMDIPFDDRLVVVDVRKPAEFADGHIKDARNIPLSEMSDPAVLANLEEDQNIYVHCAGGYRSVIASSLIKRQGIHNLRNVVGGWDKIKEQEKVEIVKETSVLN